MSELKGFNTTVYLYADLKPQLEKLAKSRRRSINFLINEAIERYLEKNFSDQEKKA